MRRLFLILTILVFANCLFAQNTRIVFKLKKSAPVSIVNDVISGIPSKNSPAGIIRKFSAEPVNRLFAKSMQNISAKDKTEFALDRIFVFNVQEQSVSDAVRELMKNPYVDYAEKVKVCRLESNAFTPNDTYFQNQYYLNSVNMISLYGRADATNVIIGVVDSGLDFGHPDLQQSFYINQGEYGNGKESNGIDDDGNGFIDDWRGWNFIGNNNQPDDDNLYSHGTSVASILSAGFNNNTGITPAAPFSKCLVMKCFNAQGQGYEDNIAEAILYGVTLGVRIFNFSFGDYIYSNLLKDVISYAYSKNAVMISSAGNDNTDLFHYPSSFDEVISAGASDELDRKASFSAYGNTVDIYAPGVNILTASRTGLGSAEFGSNYQYSAGTSFSAPIVAGAAAILRAANPNLTNEEIRGILVSSTRYFPGQTGWDYIYASGILNVESSFNNSNNPSSVRIFSPYLNFPVTNDTVPIFISAASAFFRSYTVSYGIGMNPSQMNTVFTSGSQAIRDTVAYWHTGSLPDTTILLTLSVATNNGRTIEHRTYVRKDNSAPSFGAYDSKEIVYQGSFAERIRFLSNVPATGIIHYRIKNSGSPYSLLYADEGNLGFLSQEHYAYIRHTQLQTNTQYEFYLELISFNGKSTTLNDASFVFTSKSRINPYGYTKKSYSLPQSEVCGTVLSVLNDGRKTLITNSIKNNLYTEAYNFNNGIFEKISPAIWLGTSVARDIADINGNGKYDLLTSQQRNGSIYEAPAYSQLPSVQIWNNETGDEYWSSKFADVDEDNTKEILGFGLQGLKIMKYQGSFVTSATLPFYPSGTGAFANSQTVLTGDYNNNGKTDIVFTNNYIDSDNNQNTTLNLYEHGTGTGFSRVYSIDYPSLVMKGENLTDGDFDGDGKKEFAAGYSSDPKSSLNLFLLVIYKYVNGQYTETAVLEFYNNYNGDGFCRAGDIDNDGKDEILVNFDKNFYIIKYENGNYTPVYYSPDYSSYNGIIYDFDGNGTKEIGINNNDSLVFIEKDVQFAGPQTPSDFTGYSADSNSVILNFSPVQGADYYRIYRGNSDTTGYTLYDSAYANIYTDNSVYNKRDYYYKVSAYAGSFQIKESRLSDYVKVHVHNKLRMTAASYSEGLLSVSFSGAVSLRIPEMSAFILNGTRNPLSAGVKDQNTYVLSFNPKLQNGSYTIGTKGLKDFYGSPVDTNVQAFTVNNTDSSSFYLTSVALSSASTLRAEFNANTDTTTSVNAANYTFEPFGITVVSVQRDAVNKNVLYIKLSGSNIGASGRSYFLRVSNIYSENGVRITQGSGSVFSLSFVKEDLSSAVVYPNPFNRTASVNKKIMFANLTKTATVTVYSLTGVLLAELKTSGENGGIEWDARDTKGNELPTGVYIFRVEGKNSAGLSVDEKTGKFAVIK
ncbi:MAG: S8 family serine peptidase [Bacteroidetes bacterium]|nr:S8 family serine peptidase [Bacteroidota bacterium]